MRFVFASAALIQMYVRGDHRYHPDLLKAFRRVVDTLAAAPDERALRALRGLRLEKLRGNRAGQYSVTLNDQYRLILSIESDDEGNYLTIMELTDYH